MRHAGSLEAENAIQAEYGTALNGEVIVLYIVVEAGAIAQASFKAFGSPALLGGAEYVCRWLTSHSLEQAKALTAHQLLADLELPPVKVHVVSMLEKVLQKCLQEVK